MIGGFRMTATSSTPANPPDSPSLNSSQGCNDHTATPDPSIETMTTATSSTKSKKRPSSGRRSKSSMPSNTEDSKTVFQQISDLSKLDTNATTDGQVRSTHVSILESATSAASNPDTNESDKNALIKAKSKKTMTEMIHQAIVALKDRTGSSQAAIQKYILATWSELDDNPTFRSRLFQTLKKGVSSNHFLKVKASYKISPEWHKQQKAKRAKEAMRKVAQKKKRELAKKLEGDNKSSDNSTVVTSDLAMENMAESPALTPEAYEEIKRKQELKLERQRIKEDLERKGKERAERLKRRRFPMEDTRLHEEDKELGVTSGTTLRPGALPLFFQIARDSKATAQVPSRCDALDMDTRGLVSDLLQVYHFFRGDVRFGDIIMQYAQQSSSSFCCDFTLSHLVFAVDEILMGNARKSYLVPPLIQHLFLCCLSILTAPSIATATVSGGTSTSPKQEVGSGDMTTSTGVTKEQKQLHQDLEELAEALSPSSWPEVCCMYMECMDRYYKSVASQDPSVLPPGVTDVSYLFRVTNVMTASCSSTASVANGSGTTSSTLPKGYNGYFGHDKSVLAKAFDKLNRQEIWTLQADELIALLRALTDDVIATHPDIMMEISNREEKLAALTRDKRAADANYRKVKLGLEGPPPSKKPALKKKDDEEDKEGRKNETRKNGKVYKETESLIIEKPFKPTTTKKQLEQARREQVNANEAYEKGLKTLVARTEPVGYDRHHNRYFHFAHDPRFVFIEVNRSVLVSTEHLPQSVQLHKTSWHVIHNVSVLNQFASTLDVRGNREKALYELLVGSQDAPQKAIKNYIVDDVNEKSFLSSFENELKHSQQQLEDVRLNMLRLEEEGRRPSRFQCDQVVELESKIVSIENKIAKASELRIPDYAQLTGLEVLRRFDNKMKRFTRRLDSEYVGPMPCADLVPHASSSRSGMVGFIVDDILHVEALCQDLVPWEAMQAREKWITTLEDLATAWNESCTFLLGPESKNVHGKGNRNGESPEGHRMSVGSNSRLSSEGGKRQRHDSSGRGSTQLSIQQTIAQIKQPLLDLEERIYQVSGLAMADRDQDIADDNMSAADEANATEEDLEREKSKLLLTWRKKAYIIKQTPAKKPGLIKEALLQAITAARNAHLAQIVAQLRSALLLFHSDAAGECKQAVIAILEEHGGYDPVADDDDDEDDSKSEDDDDDTKTPVASNLCYEAVSLFGSLGDDDKATRTDWTDAVRQCKSSARLAALSTAFCRKAMSILEKLKSERKSLEKALEKWQREEDRKKQPRGGRKISRTVVEPSTEMWANVDYTNEFCMVRLDNHPWWPAKKCIAKDPSLQESLRMFDRVLVAMVGEHGELRCVKSEDIRAFTGSTIDENLEEFTKEDRSQLKQSLAVARRIIRGQKIRFDDEKKTGF